MGARAGTSMVCAVTGATRATGMSCVPTLSAGAVGLPLDAKGRMPLIGCRAAALRGLELYDEVVEDARQHPGSHPNIDILLRVAEGGDAVEIVVEQEQQ